MVRLSGLCRHFREGEARRTVFDGLDLSIARGERVVLYGRSGSGKTTLLNLVSGIDRPDAGRVEIDGTRLDLLDEEGRTRFRRAHVGFIHQFFNLLPTLTVLENLLLPLELNGLDDAAGRARAEALLGEVGLAERRDSFPDRLSGGEQQRVAVARALVHEPRLLLADEPTGNLDAETGAAVLELLRRLADAAGRTLLVATHSREAAAIADRVLVFDHGRLTVPPPAEAR
ncbi:MAG: ABC transporter ATP-binding protein [Gammaproteobacteria bacterium]|nr:ABC transporter ATP-binding protein [Gammaproteobacteria bacterium]